MLLYRSKYLFVNYLEVQFLTHIKFFPEVKEINSTEFKAHFMVFINEMVKRKGRHIMIDTENIESFCDSDFISWFNRIVLPQIKSVKTDKIAWLFKNGFAQEIKIEEKLDKIISQKLFTDSKKAMNWLLEGAKRKSLSFENGKKPPSHHHH
ncbi:MAG: hypothetical protein U9Q83_09450 [Bacteroidota bacterium]|nr:hypothetical protein [Bacteroidota bacterium]